MKMKYNSDTGFIFLVVSIIELLLLQACNNEPIQKNNSTFNNYNINKGPVYDTSIAFDYDTAKAIIKTSYIGTEKPKIFEAAFLLRHQPFKKVERLIFILQILVIYQ